MDQQAEAGHHVITRDAVEMLFASGVAKDGKIDGLDRDHYFHTLDQAQEHQDRVPGPTAASAYHDGPAQREHAMADPRLSGQANLAADRKYVEDEVGQARDAHAQGSATALFEHLGKAVHSLQDSYSDAHAFRGDGINQGDPRAAVQAFDVFNPIYARLPFEAREQDPSSWGTHTGAFDKVAVNEHGDLVRGSDIAAARATAEMLISYYQTRDRPSGDASNETHRSVGEFYRSDVAGVRAYEHTTEAAWRAERDQRLALHAEEVAHGGYLPSDVTHDSARVVHDDGTTTTTAERVVTILGPPAGTLTERFSQSSDPTDRSSRRTESVRTEVRRQGDTERVVSDARGLQESARGTTQWTEHSVEVTGDKTSVMSVELATTRTDANGATQTTVEHQFFDRHGDDHVNEVSRHVETGSQGSAVRTVEDSTVRISWGPGATPVDNEARP